MTQNRLLRMREVEYTTGTTRSPTYDRIADGLFIAPVSIGGGRVAWPENEVQAIVAARIAGRSDDEIRQLVIELETKRTGKPATPRRKVRVARAA